MSILPDLVHNVSLPDLFKVTRQFADDGIRDIPAAVHSAMAQSGLAARLPRGGGIAIAVGSRGMGRLPDIVRAVVGWFTEHGTRPFIVPAMGSHGGATAAGQVNVLHQLGVTEASAGCPIRSSMEVVEVGMLPRGFPVYMDALASAADGVFVINRVKVHTAFSGPHESGLVKMLTIGLGKQRGADSCHALGFGLFAEVMPEMATLMLEKKANLLGGLASVENAYDAPCLLEAILPERFLERDAALMAYARQRMPSLPVATLDVLLVGRMGKNISGGGMDPNITGRAPTPYKTGPLQAAKVGVLRLTPESKGNATGLGNADVTTKRLFDAVDFDYTYANVITSTVLKSGFVPVVMPTDESAVRCLLKTCNAGNRPVRLAYIRDTLTLDRFWVSPAVAEELRGQSDCEVAPTPTAFAFDAAGDLTAPLWPDHDHTTAPGPTVS